MADGTTQRSRVLGSLAGIALLLFGAAYLLRAASRPPVRQGTAKPQISATASAQDIPASERIQPDELAKQIAGKDKPIVVCVAPRFLYDGAHVPGAVFHGPASKPDGLSDLKQWAKSVPRGSNIVLYCGCCPLTRCPNLRPAAAALQEMGFTHMKVLWLPQDFHTDWIQKGYPVEKAQ